jgi:hypothetical protein
MQNQPRAAGRVGGIDSHVPCDRTRTDRAAEGIPPEAGEGSGVCAIEVQSCENQTRGGHD